jgi:hypothetical protein
MFLDYFSFETDCFTIQGLVTAHISYGLLYVHRFSDSYKKHFRNENVFDGTSCHMYIDQGVSTKVGV